MPTPHARARLTALACALALTLSACDSVQRAVDKAGKSPTATASSTSSADPGGTAAHDAEILDPATGHVAGTVRSLGAETATRLLKAYWTPERIAAAEPADVDQKPSQSPPSGSPPPSLPPAGP
ncbi:MAG: hypothetical protein HOV79_31015, partial [Hamadaea sp.]|nr:hypothetical protein [Hamadaea sp.]